MGAGRRPSGLGQYGLRRRLRALPAWLGAAVRGAGPERDVLVQAAKTALAATLAWVIAEHWLDLPQSFLAPYAAMFMVSATVYRSVTGALQQVAAVGLGLVLAFVVVRFVGPELAALAVMVAVGALLGRWRGFGENGQWVAATALLVFTYGMAADATMLGIRLAETAGGAALGALINVLVLPPVHLRDARTAIDSLAAEVADLLEEFAGTLREGGWRSGQVDDWCHRVYGLERRIRRAERAVSWQRESTRFNPRSRIGRKRRSAPVPPDLTPVLSTLRQLEFPLAELADVAPSVGRRDTGGGPESGIGEPLGEAVAGVAEAVRHLADGGSCGARTEGCPIRRAVDRTHTLAERLGDHPPRPRVWAGTGALLHSVDRMISQMEPHCQCERPDEPGREPLVTRG
ncbi:FUSC family protein [Actinoalloteichus spitiensis]|uniref:FUSC family protein n=1 Tax=Actinoalloteichus spitiensis TaxID=252394 RepID=UPI000372284D|nr:aromatic acid exporter family protein [Actinoalloteichus spitiensis]